MSQAEGLQPNSVGSVKSTLISKLKTKPGKMSTADISAQDIATFAMWIDLCIPHSGDYTDDMKDADKQKYLARLKIRQDLDSMEAKNIRDCLAAGALGGCLPAGDTIHHNNIGMISNTSRTGFLFNVQSLTNGKKLVFQLPEAGNIALMDVLGRQILSQSVDKNAVQKSVVIRTKLTKGIYIVKFKGAAITEHRVINVL
jgi:hypothetical protein